MDFVISHFTHKSFLFYDCSKKITVLTVDELNDYELAEGVS